MRKTRHTQRMTARLYRFTAIFLIAAAISACATTRHQPLAAVQHVDLERFIGDWYVIANIPTSIERDAYNAVESYELAPDGTIRTTFTFLDGGFTGKEKRYTPRGFVLDKETNAVWGMQFVWPVKAEYRIIYLADDYSQTVIGRTKRDYVWIMAREPVIPMEDFTRLRGMLSRLGYDVTKLRHVPQRWG
jgi:apolipoprotein D and lipocalin family protein